MAQWLIKDINLLLITTVQFHDEGEFFVLNDQFAERGKNDGAW